MKFENIKDEEFLEVLNIISPDNFLKHMVKVGELQKITDDYCSDCYSLCRNSISFVIKCLMHTIYEFSFKIVEGTFNGKDHAWIEIGDYYVDLTLKQFVFNAPKIAVTLKNSANGYEVEEIMSWDNWAKIQ